MSKLQEPPEELWRRIVRGAERFATDNPRKIHYMKYDEVLILARRCAEESGQPVRIAAYYFDRWYAVDVVYPRAFSK